MYEHSLVVPEGEDRDKLMQNIQSWFMYLNGLQQEMIGLAYSGVPSTEYQTIILDTLQELEGLLSQAYAPFILSLSQMYVGGE